MSAVPRGRRPAVAASLLVAMVAAIPVTPASGTGVGPADTVVGEAPAGSWPAPPPATATSYVLLDQDTGQVLAERAADMPRPVASTIKILTALTVLERASLDDVVTAGDEVVGVPGASVGLRPGDRWTVGELLDALIVRSGNEAALALAVHVGGTVDAFIDLMRADARALGMDVPVLASVNGLSDANRLTARQLAQLTRAAMADERFRAVAAKRTVTLPGRPTERSRNELLGVYDGATGVKTGYTSAAGWSVIASAARNGRELVAVVLDSRSAEERFEDAAALLDHGFDGFVRVAATADLALRQAGRWIRYTSSTAPLLVPVSDPAVTLEQPLPVEPPGGPVDVRVSWHGSALAELVADPVAAERSAASSGAAVGRFLLDRAYAAMRAATRAEAWTR